METVSFHAYHEANAYASTVDQWLSIVIRAKLLQFNFTFKGKSKGLPQQAEVAQGVPDRLRSRIFLTFGTTKHRPPLPQENSLVLIFRG